MQKNWKKVLLVWNRNAELLRLLGATFDSKVAFLRTMRNKNVIILKSLQKKKFLPFLVLFVCRCWHLSCQISIESVRKIVICLLNALMAVLYLNFFCQYYNNLRFYWAIINRNFIWNIVLYSGVYCDLRNKSVHGITLSSCLIWQIISFILSPNEYGCVAYAWTSLR